MNYKLVLAYDGTRYNGWQRQGNTEKTIQGRLEQVLERMAGEPVELQGSGRTDAGVHAEGQTASFHLKGDWRPEQIMEYLNRYLPEDIAVRSCSTAAPRFHSRLSAVSKTYRYQIETAPRRDVFQRNYYYGLGLPLDVERMEQAAALLTGTHDFRSFCGNRSMKKSTVRTIEELRLVCPDETKRHLLVTGNGFLQQMVRILAGTLIEVGLGKRRPEEMTEILAARSRRAAGFTAPAQGLFLVNVRYETDEAKDGDGND